MESNGARNASEAQVDRSSGVLQLLGQVVGLLAGFAAVIYFAGAVVLSLRLAFERLPWTNVVSELPREFILSIGAGEVLLPALVVGAFYGLYRLVHDDSKSQPITLRWREGGMSRIAAIGGYVFAFGLMIIPLGAVLLVRGLADGFEPQAQRIGAGCLVLILAAIAVQEARSAWIDEVIRPHRWPHLSGAAAMVGLYVVAAMPAMMVAAAAIPLSEAKICTTDHSVAAGFLVGESSESVYLGEQAQPDHPRRLAIFPQTRVAEVFTGKDAGELRCELGHPKPPLDGSDSADG